ncbi:DUF4828 domain-containing protein [Pisciglobus halotolerans]|uniref:DUF4828 domain-containing protein n=1 Tax=Pisciglobus halotolerans TaxID=745365 RepID=A0A1I3C6I8_9LACT|nr:DUF4828 domain-containing protein [Pisciglobus halotolerans]SFH70195.1 protein of unknown function [Pisciglobus halotolerans]
MASHRLLKYLLSASFIAGLTRASLKYKESKTNQKNDQLLSPYLGNWHMQDPAGLFSGQLLIDAEENIVLNGKAMKGSVTALTKDQLVYTDHFGYELTFKVQDENNLTLLDSADDKTYLLKKID